VIAYTAAPVFLAAVIDRVVAVVRRHVLGMDEQSAWTSAGTAVLRLAALAGAVTRYALRFILAPPSTASGLRRIALAAAPLPEDDKPAAIAAVPEITSPYRDHLAEACPVHGSFPEGLRVLLPPCPLHPAVPELPSTKKAAFLALYRQHPGYGERGQASATAAEIAPQADLQPGTGRTYIYEELAALSGKLNGGAS
jgi:hypothetical protein